MALTKYRSVLRHRLKLDDTRWDFTVPDLPNAADCDRSGFVKTCKLAADAVKQDLTLSFTRISTNRAISNRTLSHFVLVTCDAFRLQTEDGKSATFRESSDYVSRLLKTGIDLNGIHYSFYGHSNSQLKSRSCFLMAGTQKEVDNVVESLGDFTTMKTVAKKVKRIGLLFSTADIVVTVHPDRCRDVADIERDEYNFTDGCGGISPKLARLLSQRRPILFRNKRYHPSVFQIRYRGYKGVVMVEPKMKAEYHLELRKSMRKFSGGEDYSFAVVEYSKPYTYGYLNDETVLLLHSLGIHRDVLSKKQHEYLNFLQLADADARSAFRFLCAINELHLAEKVLLDGLESVRKKVQKRVGEEHAKMLNKKSEHRCRILIPSSRLLFGICDPYGLLGEGECFVKPTLEGDGVPHALSGASVLVARNPCLHPGDLRKLRAVARTELSHLTDCIVFSTRGRRPAADMMSGGDLDGDQFFVTWDSAIIPDTISQAAEYPGGKEPVQFAQITSHDRIDYFARSSSMQLGQIKNLYLRWARLKGPLSPECQELNRLFSQCVDASRIKIPDRLMNLPLSCHHAEPFILGFLHDLAAAQIQSYSKSTSIDASASEDTLLTALTEPSTMSQFELAQLTHHWCQKNRTSFGDFWQYFDHTSLSIEERAWFGALLPATETSLEIISNDLMHSDILSHEELAALGLRHASIRWNMERTFPYFTRKLLVLHIYDRLSVALYLPKTIQSSDEFPLNNAGRLFAFPHRRDQLQSSRIVVPTKHNTRFVFHQSGFQLYEGTKANTFVFFTRSPNDDSRYRSVEGTGRKARLREQTIQEGINHEWRTSIALNKFSQGLGTHIGRLYREGVAGAELYVISNNDTRSIRNVDLWLEQIDTDKVHRNFEYEDDPGPLPPSFDWTAEPDSVISMAKDHNFSSIGTIATHDNVARVLRIAWLTSDSKLVADLYSHWTDHLKQLAHVTPRDQAIAARMIEHLMMTPLYVIYLIKLCPWSELHLPVREALSTWTTSMVRALVLCANIVDRLTTDMLKVLLKEIPILNTDQLRGITQLVALTIRSPEAALDLLMEAIQPMITRLLLNTPRDSEYMIKMLAAIAVDHIEEAQDLVKSSRASNYHWRFDFPVEIDGGAMMLKCNYRLDAPKVARLAVGDQVRFICVVPPPNLTLTKQASFETLVEKSDVGQIMLRCLRHPPSFYQQCSWKAELCGSFVTCQTMIDAVTKLVSQKQACCDVFPHLFPSREQGLTPATLIPSTTDLSQLNPSQCQAVSEALAGPLTCIWGPPGTGKTHTIVSIIREILTGNNEQRLLVTAPTHNAVDNVMRQYLKHAVRSTAKTTVTPLRVSTDIHKVATDLRSHTCDAMLGKDINEFQSARRKAQQQISRARLIFTTCIGAGLGLLRNEQFDNVIIDEASQQTEPASLVPLVKGVTRAILVGDHVQLRATVQPHAQALEYDVSLFERLWTESALPGKRSAVRRVMLDTQYRMHPNICAFPSQQFYEGKLLTSDHCRDILVPQSAFPWPSSTSRAVFIQTSALEDIGSKSKSNSGQAKLCQEVVCMLRCTTGPAGQKQEQSKIQRYSIAILTPYTRQAEHLRSLLPDETISSIDGFQGQEADIIIYVTVRCNAHREIGFLKDMRRLNVALTRAKAGLIVIGDEATLTGKGKVVEDGEQLEECYQIWKRMIEGMSEVRWREEQASLLDD